MVILGNVEGDGAGSRIRITIRMDWFGFAVMILILAVIAFGVLQTASNELALLLPAGVFQLHVFLTLLFYLGMFSFGYLMMSVQLVGEWLSRKSLYRLFEVQQQKDVVFFRKFLGFNRAQQFILFLIFSVVILFLATFIKLQ